MGPLATEIVERFQHDDAVRARFGRHLTVSDDDTVHLVELGARQLTVISARTEIGPVVLVAAAGPLAATREWFAGVEHVATLRSGAELWAVVGAVDLLTWAREPATTPTDRRRVGLALLQLGETLHRSDIRHGAVEGAMVVVEADGEPRLLPWAHDGVDDRARLQALGVAVLASAVDRSLGPGFGSLGLLRPADLTTPGEGERWTALRSLADAGRAAPDLRFALQRSVDSLERVCGDATASSVLDADVRFSAFHASTTCAHDWARLLVLAHHGGRATDEDGAVVDVDALVDSLARDHLGPDADPRQSTAAHSVPVVQGDQLTFAVHCTGADLEAASQSLAWAGPIEEAVFWLHPHPDAVVIDGAVDIFVGAFIRGRIPFSIPVGETTASSTSCHTVDAYRDVFVSYAHEDRAVVDALTQLNTLGDRFLIDAQELRAGQDWRARLGQMIREAEVFQLFWSSASARSAEVEVEWRHALDLRDPEEFIRPVYWQTPLPPVPEALGSLHFDFVPLGGGGAPLLAAPVPPRIDQPPDAAVENSAHASGRDPKWLQGFTRVAMVLVALFGFGAVFAGLVVTEDRGTELGEQITGPITTAVTPPPSTGLPPTASTVTQPPDTDRPDTSGPPTTSDTTPPVTGPPDTSAPSTSAGVTPTSTPPVTGPPDTSAPSTSAGVTPTSEPPPPPSTTTSTSLAPPQPTVVGRFVGPLDDIAGGSRYPIELTVTNGPVTITAIAATDRDGQPVAVLAPPLPAARDDGSDVVDVDLASEAGSIAAIDLFFDTPAGDDLRVTITDLP